MIFAPPPLGDNDNENMRVPRRRQLWWQQQPTPPDFPWFLVAVACMFAEITVLFLVPLPALASTKLFAGSPSVADAACIAVCVIDFVFTLFRGCRRCRAMPPAPTPLCALARSLVMVFLNIVWYNTHWFRTAVQAVVVLGYDLLSIVLHLRYMAGRAQCADADMVEIVMHEQNHHAGGGGGDRIDDDAARDLDDHIFLPSNRQGLLVLQRLVAPHIRYEHFYLLATIDSDNDASVPGTEPEGDAKQRTTQTGRCCGICQERLGEECGSAVLVCIQCVNPFHVACIVTWQSQCFTRGRAATCPLCRLQILYYPGGLTDSEQTGAQQQQQQHQQKEAPTPTAASSADEKHWSHRPPPDPEGSAELVSVADDVVQVVVA